MPCANSESIHSVQFNNDENYNEDCKDRNNITLTNTALFLHENSNRIESELEHLEEQVRRLQEIDEVLENVKRDLLQLATMNQFTQTSATTTELGQSSAVLFSSDCAVGEERNTQ